MLLCQTTTETTFGKESYGAMTYASGEGPVKKRKATTNEEKATDVVLECARSGRRKRLSRDEYDNGSESANGSEDHHDNPNTTTTTSRG